MVEIVMPPVRAPMRRCSVVASSSEVPACVISPVSSESSGTSDSGSRLRSSSTSAYTTPAHGSGWVSRGTAPFASADTSVGTVLTERSKSDKPTRGMVARSEGESSAS
eukprot:scaffold14850_cov73-Isochrysis_galbana.AAC.1